MKRKGKCSGLKTKKIYKNRIMSEKKVYNKHIILIVIWSTVFRLVDEVISLDHPGHFASWVIR